VPDCRTGVVVSVVRQRGEDEQDEPGSVEAFSGPTVLRILLGNQLRQFREAAGITPDRAGYEIRASRSKISRMEHGRVGFKERDVADLLTLYGVTDELTRTQMLVLVEHANSQGWWARYDDVLPDWFETYIGLEQAASLIRTYELQFVPGLFQVEEYVRAVTLLRPRSAPTEEIERRVSLRIKRQEILARETGPKVWAVIDESALRRPLGGLDVMRIQLQHLIEVAELPQVTLQVMPFDRGGHSGAGGSFSILRFAEADLPDVIYIEQLTGALYLDRTVEIDHYREVMNSLSAEALTPTDSDKYLKKLLQTM
jgi:transcriptional regulator with XRE-family HTH domain